MRIRWPFPLFSADTGGSGLAKAAAAAAGESGNQQQQRNDQQQQQGDQQQQQQRNDQQQQQGDQQQQQKPQAYRPDGLPDHLFGDSDKDTIDKLFKGYEGFRQSAGKNGAVPKDDAGYKFDAGDKLKPYMQGMSDDPLYKGILADAREAGVTDQVFQKFMPKVLERILESGNVAAPVNFDEHIEALVPDDAKSLDAQGRVKASGARIQNAIAYLEGAIAQNAFSKDAAENKAIGEFVVAALGDHKYGVRALEWIKSLDRKAQPITTRGSAAGAKSDADFDAMMADPRYDPNSTKFDRDYAASVDKQMQDHYG